jgi:hypothetical protein
VAWKSGELFAILSDAYNRVLGRLGMIVCSESARVPEDLDPSSEALYQKVMRRVISQFIACYIIGFLNPQSVGFAEQQFRRDLRFSEAVYRIGSRMFYLGYILSEIPINMSAFCAGCWEPRKQGHSPAC